MLSLCSSLDGSETKVSQKFSPDAGFPAIDLYVIWIEYRDGHRSRGFNFFVSRIFRSQFHIRFAAFAGSNQTINGETQIGKHIVIDDVVKEDGIGIERILGQDDAIVERLLFANDSAPVETADTLERSVLKGCEAFHKTQIKLKTDPFSNGYKCLTRTCTRQVVGNGYLYIVRQSQMRIFFGIMSKRGGPAHRASTVRIRTIAGCISCTQ